jgi:hypothetical protein
LGELSRYDDLSTDGTVLHDLLEDGVGGSTDGYLTEELILQGLGLSRSTKSTVDDTLSLDEQVVLVVIEALLDQTGQLLDATTLWANYLLGLSGLDEDLGLHGSYTHLEPGVTGNGECA